MIEKPGVLIADLGSGQNNKRMGETLRLVLHERQLARKLTWVICPYQEADLDKKFGRSTIPMAEVLADLPVLRIQDVAG